MICTLIYTQESECLERYSHKETIPEKCACLNYASCHVDVLKYFFIHIVITVRKLCCYRKTDSYYILLYDNLNVCSVMRVINRDFVVAVCAITQCLQVVKVRGLISEKTVFAI